MVRSASSVGLSVVKVIFSWQTNIYQARQLITERLQEVRDRLPANASPQISPITSPIATILMYALAPKVPTASDATSPMELRQLVDQKGVNRLLAVAGVSATNENAAGRVIVSADQELIGRGIGRATSVADLVRWRQGRSPYFGQVWAGKATEYGGSMPQLMGNPLNVLPPRRSTLRSHKRTIGASLFWRVFASRGQGVCRTRQDIS
ncbi:efflux RND transporter permease subunit [Thermosynechococcus sp.]|uniref:efflux RND transporter permease subunit n=1 Tax=Thermosynechococcus sp. TaxID=2814275 RepID=UPI00391D3B9A